MQGVNKMDYYISKFGKERVEQMLPHMTSVFAEEGLEYSLEGMTGNTMDSHRLAEWAKKEHGLAGQDALMTKMFDSYFCEAKYLGDKEVLVSAAERAGLPADAARAVLEDDEEMLHMVKSELKLARQLRVSGVPFFVIHPIGGGRPMGLSGAQPAETFVQVFEDCGLERAE